ncbi:MAG: helix-turn-helix domain-containing protein [Pseudomonadota bacterium]
MILDNAADIIARDGITNLSMERISQQAAISKSLVYNYFDSLTDLLRELLERELKALRRQQFEAAESANTFEELVRGVTHAYLTYIDERGLIIERLQSEPSLAAGHDPTYYSRDTAVSYLAPIVSRHFDMPEDLARAATDISFGLPASAGEYLLRGEMDREALEDLTVSMIIGTFVMVRNDFLTRKQRLKR